MPYDDDESPETGTSYRSRTTSMRNAVLVIGFIAFFLASRVWATYGYYNTWYYLGGWGILAVFVLFLWGPLLIANKSPNFSSPKMRGTIALPQPILTVPPQGGWPEMVMYDPGSVRGLGIEEHKMSARGYVWLPSTLAFILGEGGRGVNVNANCRLVQLSEHCELAPHLYDAMIKYPKYKPEVPVWVGLFPEYINEPTPEQLEYFKVRCEDYGITREVFDGDGKRPPFRAVLEEYASTLSRFQYPETTAFQQMLDMIMRSQNALIDKLKKDNSFFKSEITALQDLYKVRREVQPESRWLDRLSLGGEQQPPERENQEQRRY